MPYHNLNQTDYYVRYYVETVLVALRCQSVVTGHRLRRTRTVTYRPGGFKFQGQWTDRQTARSWVRLEP